MIFQKLKNFLFKNTAVGQTILKNTLWLTLGAFLSKLVRAFLIVYAGRLLGTSGYGIFSYALSLAAFFTVFSDVGISGLLTRQIVQKPSETNRYLSTSFVIKIVMLVITILLTVLVAPQFTKIEGVVPLIPIVAFLLAFDSLRNFGFSITRAYNKMEIESTLTFLTNLLITILGFTVLILFPSPKNLAIGYTLASGIGTLIVFKILLKYIKKGFWQFDKTLIKPIFKYAIPFGIIGILGAFMLNVDIIIIGMFKSAYSLGLYGAAQRIVQFSYLFPVFISVSMFPIISRFIRDKERNNATSLINKLSRIVLVISLPLSVGGILASKEIIVFLFGIQYIQATAAFSILLLTVPIVALSAIVTSSLFALNKQNVFILSGLIGAIINVVFDFVLIPKYGIAGSAIVTVGALLASMLYNIFQLKRVLHDVKMFISPLKPLFAVIAMVVIEIFLQLISTNVIITILASGSIYVALLYIFKDRSIKEMIKLVKKIRYAG